MSPILPREAKAVIVGGGIIGCSVAYHLARLGWRDVVLLEQGRLGGGTTWHAAGLVGRLRTSTGMTAINKYSAELYAGLERETGHPTGWADEGGVDARFVRSGRYEINVSGQLYPAAAHLRAAYDPGRQRTSS